MTSLIKSGNTVISPNRVLGRNIKISGALFIICGSFLFRLCCIGSHNLLVEEAYYWNYAQHLDFGYLDHPPMVALLIKISTIIFGTNEFSIRVPALLCWLFAALLSYKWTELINRGSGQYAVMVLSILPFFFLQSLVTTPDQPLLVCWSAALYCLYRALILDEPRYWYLAGVCLGLGMLSKYTIVLLGPAVLLYMSLVPSARYWFARKEPYVCAFIALLLFTPVIYWNFIHEWASFAFQSTRRFQAKTSFSFHYFIGVLVLFLLPSGVDGLWRLFNKTALQDAHLAIRSQRFLQIFTLVPLVFFGVFSFNHPIKLDWIGPGLLAVIPWLAVLMTNNKKSRSTWCIGGVFVLLCYALLIGTITLGVPQKISQKYFQKLIAWERLTQQFHSVATQVETNAHRVPILVPLDLYNIGSELAFYQAKLLAEGKVQEIFPIVGRHVFGSDSLMYRYWTNGEELSGKTLILISTSLRDFDMPTIINKVIVQDPPHELWSYSQGQGAPIAHYYYEVVQMR